MAKAQKTVMIPEDLYRIIADHEKTTGASFTRITIAALLQYLFHDPEGPNPVWMEDAVALELGEIVVGTMPDVRKDIETANASAALRWCDGDLESDGYCAEFHKIATRRWGEWNEIVKREGRDRVQKIIDYRAELRNQRQKR